MEKIKRLLVIFLMCLICVSVIAGCSTNYSKSSPMEIYGGDIAKYSLAACSDATLSYEFPIIINREIDTNEFKFMGFNTGVGTDIEQIVKYNQISDPIKYKDWYCYFMTFDVDTSKVDKNLVIDSINLKINGKEIRYKVDSFEIDTAKNVVGEEYNCDNSDVVFEYGGPTVMYHILPDDKQTISYEIKEDCIIDSLEIQKFVDIKDKKYYVNGESVEYVDGLSVRQGDELCISYKLQYKQGINDYDMVKTGMFLKYTQKGNRKCAMVLEQGIVVVNSNEDQFIKDYIDKKL